MKVYMQAIGFSANESLEDYLNEKLSKLDNYFDQIVAANVFLKLDNNNSKDNKIVEVKLEVPGDDIVVTKNGVEFTEAIDLAMDTLKRLVIKKKEKMANH